MADFSYTARDKGGAIRQGRLAALDRSAAAGLLVDQGLVPILVKEGSGAGLLERLKHIKLGRQKVKTSEKVIFSRQFATMINAGVPIVEALGILSEQAESKVLKGAIEDAAKKVQGGSSLAAALSDHSAVFTPIYINMVRAGEVGGILDQVLDRLATQQEKDAEIVGKVKGAMIYPGVITSVTIIAFIFLMTVIVPKLAVVFDSLDAKLPTYTRVMLAVSHLMSHYIVFLIVAAGAGIFALVRFVKTKRGKRLFDRLILRAPVFGPIVIKVNSARFARIFGSLLTAGISVLEALQATSQALGNTMYKEDVMELANQARNGKPLAQVLKGMKRFPPIVSHMVAVGEETGELDKILLKLAEFYEKEVDAVIAGITSIIEPFLIIILGVIVGSVVASVFGPLANLTNSIQ